MRFWPALIAPVGILLSCHTSGADIEEIILGENAQAFHLESTTRSITTFASNSEAELAVQRILDHVGLPKNFVIRAADVPNASAVIQGSQRLVLYSSLFMNRVRQATSTDWGAISILAHEVGHHLSGHTLSAAGSNRVVELEADRFSGFILARMGASMEDATAAMRSFGSDVASATHPARSARLEAIAAGWTQAREQTQPNPPVMGQAGQSGLSSTCRFSQGPRAGQTQDYRGQVQPIPVGSPCTDGQGSYGVAIPDGSGGGSGPGNGQLSSTCRFSQGPRAGQIQDYRGQVQPIPVGSPCTDGQGSYGMAIPDASGGGSAPGSNSGQLSSTCRFSQGPRAGQIQSYRGQVQPIPVGSPCTDGQGSNGVAIPD